MAKNQAYILDACLVVYIVTAKVMHHRGCCRSSAGLLADMREVCHSLRNHVNLLLAERATQQVNKHIRPGACMQARQWVFSWLGSRTAPV